MPSFPSGPSCDKSIATNSSTERTFDHGISDNLTLKKRLSIPTRLMTGYLLSKYTMHMDHEFSIMNIIKCAVNDLEDGGVLLHTETRHRRIYALFEAVARSNMAERCLSVASWPEKHIFVKKYPLVNYAILVAAAANGEYAAVEEWLDSQTPGKNIFFAFGIFGSPVSAALSRGHFDIAKLLLDSGADVNCVEYSKLTPLHVACYKGDLRQVELLFTPKYKLDTLDRSEKSFSAAIRTAMKCHHWEIANYLLANSSMQYSCRSTLRYSIFHTAAIAGDCEILLQMLDTGLNPNTNCHSYKEPFGNQTALGCAAIMGHVKAVRLLIDRNWDNIEHYGFGNALLGAAQHGQLSIVSILLDVGVDINYIATGNQWNTRPATPLSASLRAMRMDTTRYLLERGADVNAGDKGASSLLLACKRGNEEIVRMLVERGVDPNGHASQRSKRNVPMLTALKRGHVRVAGVLLQLEARGVKPGIYDND
jgi:ankyrin repeat protein